MGFVCEAKHNNTTTQQHNNTTTQQHNNKMKQYLLLIALFILTGTAFAQDHHISQFYAAPLTLNPALTGSMGGKYRVTALYRNQWQTVLEDPFKTMMASFDMSVKMGGSNADKLGVGMFFFSDKGGSTDVSTNQVSVSAAYHKAMGMRKERFLSAGFQLGVARRDINYNALTFNDQFDGTGGYTLASEETLPSNSRGYSDLSAGLNYTRFFKSGRSFNTGVGIFHANGPNVALNEEVVSRLPTRLTAYLGSELPLTRKITILPRMLVYVQGTHMEVNTGANVKFPLGGYNGSALHLGLWLRPVYDVETSMALDAAVLLIGFETDNFAFGMSYDANLSSLSAASSYFGGFELSMTYVGNDENEGVLCPAF